MKNETQKTESTLVAPAESPLMTAAALVQQADGKIDVDKLEALLKVQMQWEANEAKKAYVVAMAAFKESPPEILKDKTVGYSTTKGTTNYKHASLYNVTTKINTELSKHGLTAAWVTSQDNGGVKVTCKITHTQGHNEETCLSAPPDQTGSKNAIQAIGSTVTYLQRYTLLALTGLATCGQDDDGKGAGQQAGKPTKKEEQQKIVDQAFFDFECEQKEALLEGYMYSKESFVEAIIKHYGQLPTRKESVKKILATVKPEEVMVEKRDDLDDFPNE